jgi:hypothetical protein
MHAGMYVYYCIIAEYALGYVALQYSYMVSHAVDQTMGK